ncbi:MAG: hypothetical protein AAFZ87_10170, partial [Planctomycetota bacterium]
MSPAEAAEAVFRRVYSAAWESGRAVQSAHLLSLEEHYIAAVRESLPDYDLLPLFDARIAASALDRAREHHGEASEQERVVVIGDTPNDVRCARS